jgi:sterol desaturase/sphingolipid hydroxylase (fatty acid hydroxylase superfamily)
MRTAMTSPTPYPNSNDEVTTHSRIDGEGVQFGSGWISGVVGLMLSVIGLGCVLCFQFPDVFTMPQLRAYYPLPMIRGLLHLVLVVGFVLGLLSMTLRRRKRIGAIAVSITLIAALLGGSSVPVRGEVTPEGPFLGLDWFLLNLIFWSAVFIPLERMFALRPEQPIFRHGWRTDLTYFFVSSLIIQFTTIVTLKPAEAIFGWIVTSSWRLAIMAQNPFLQLLEILLITDLVQYWIHRMFHRNPILWRFHQIHHSTETMDWLAGSRLHLVDVIATRSLTYIPLFALGFSQTAMVMYAIVVTVQATFIHANVRFRFGLFRYLLVTPQFHHWHHSDQPEAIDKNFAVHLPIWDMLFGSFHLPGSRWPETYGVTDTRLPDGFFRQLVYPFKPKKHKSAG